MSLSDKVIRNTYYYTLSQSVNFIFGFILTPIIIGYLGTSSFAVYALVLGFAGIFGLFDMSVSTSFIRFISEYHNKKKYWELNQVVNTGMIFYFLFSLICCIAGIIFMNKILIFLNVTEEFMEIARLAYIISLAAFLITNTFSIFNSVLISLQKMYLTSLIGLCLTIANFISVILILCLGYGLEGLLWLHIIVISVSVGISIFYALREMPELKVNPFFFHVPTLKKMTAFGAQMQVSKLSSFASEKYDEYLLAVFSILSNVTYYNISMKIARAGRFFPFMLVPQVAPVAAEIKAREDDEKLKRLFDNTSKYLTLISFPIFTYIFVFADKIVETWMGPGFEISSYILRILVMGQLINMSFSAPGNSILPNIGIPKFQMYEGLIFLSSNLILSYVFIRNYGISGAALGNTISAIIASFFVFHVSSGYFGNSKISFVKEIYIKPILASFISSVSSGLSLIIYGNFLPTTGRINGIIIITITFITFMVTYSISIYNLNYLNSENKLVLLKTINRIIPIRYLIKIKNQRGSHPDPEYRGELVSIFIVTYNRLEFLKKCISSLIPTLKKVNYELIIWNNASTDGTKEYLESISSEIIRVIHSNKNLGTSAKAKAAELCKGDFIVGIDDDVLEFPECWLQKMISAYRSVPRMGYLATNVLQNEHTTGAKGSETFYHNMKYGNHIIQIGPAGGWCFIISREIFNEIGNFRSPENRIFFSEDEDYLRRLKAKGYRFGILKDVMVFHATGDYYNKQYKDVFTEKMKDFNQHQQAKKSLSARIRNILNIKSLYLNFLDYAERNLQEIEHGN